MKDQKKELKVNFENVDHSLYLMDYIRRKVLKPKFAKLNISPEDISIKRDHKNGTSKFILTVKVTVHKVKLFFKEVGDNIYALIDAIVRKINQKIAKFRDNRNHSKTALKYMM